ncbi:uncharacterized protein LOC5504315 isoform X1 [Nematostella vectensis]|uniref:uncharacterized protein LOC5504315 isoform X1 n=1 Tax=Nematostella vectensis TaxID=45351 RepID=UPI00207704F9|nr:uncharacterized protein LOC5504315 isoform X1 [Nematostella vectensis]
MARLMTLFIYLVLQSAYNAFAIQVSEFYPFGANSQRLLPPSQSISEPVPLRQPYSFYGRHFTTLRVHRDGVISLGLDTGVPLRHRKFPFPPDLHVIAPFYAPAVIKEGGKLWYGETTDAGVLSRASLDVRGVFVDESSLNASAVFVVTWNQVRHAHHKEGTKNNTFQAVLVTDGSNTFVLFNYATHGLQWTKGYHVRWQNTRMYHAQAGFSAGDKIRLTTLPGSGSDIVRRLATRSNMNSVGQWMFKVGWTRMRHLGVYAADSYEEEYRDYFFVEQYFKGCYMIHGYLPVSNRSHIWQDISIRSCIILCFERGSDFVAMHNGSQCACLKSVKDLVRARDDGECGMRCSANENEICGGKMAVSVYETTAHASVLSDESVRRLNDLDECAVGSAQCHMNATCYNKAPGFCCECDDRFYGDGISCIRKGAVLRMVGYITGTVGGLSINSLFADTIGYSSDGRAYVATRGLPRPLAYSIRIVIPLASVVGWMFGMPVHKGLKNGYAVVGDRFTRNVTVVFDSGEVLSIDQQFQGKDSSSPHVRVQTHLSGSIPILHPRAQVTMPLYKETYQRVRRGVIQSRAQVKYTVDGAENQFLVEQVIRYNEPRDCPPDMTSVVLEANVLMMRYDEAHSFMGIAIRGRVRNGTSDEETDTQKHEGKPTTAKPRPQTSARPRPQTTSRPQPQGAQCGAERCHPAGVCIVYQGRQECRCNHGYRGDGVTYCVSTTVRPQTTTSPPTTSRPQGAQCGPVRCHERGVCIVYQGRQECRCNHGYRGDGVTYCDSTTVRPQPTDRPRPQTTSRPQGTQCGAVKCHERGVCIVYQGRQECRCNHGYRGDGVTYCESTTVRPATTSRPKTTARPRPQGGQCGAVRCHTFGVCIVYQGRQECRCNHGYRGDGVNYCVSTTVRPQTTDRPKTTPRPQGTQCGRFKCHKFAVCITYNGEKQCRCNYGYRGDGVTFCNSVTATVRPPSVLVTTARPRPQGVPCGGITCHSLGVCITFQGRKECRCNYGYRGDGVSYCEDADECTLNRYRCDANAECINTVGSYRCKCKTGYTGDGKTCTEAVEFYCPQKCHPNAKCVRLAVGGQVCVCLPGYTGDGVSCEPDGTCEGVKCDANAQCIKTADQSQKCICKTGFVGNGEICREVDPCAGVKCGDNARCVQSKCVCNDGYQGDGQRCYDVKECARLDRCDPNADCIDTVGSYRCACKSGYTGDGSICTKVPSSVACGGKVCHTHAECFTYQGQKQCVCERGYQGNGEDCKDINECEQNHECDPLKAVCTNTEGSYSCTCRPGYGGDGRTCTPISSCGGEVCHQFGECVTDDDTGRKRCQCRVGFRGNGVDCYDMDECIPLLRTCGSNSLCRNTLGGYECVCRRGFTKKEGNCISDGSCNGGTCSLDARCDTILGCVCKSGFQGDGFNCTDIDECEPRRNRCDPNADCRNTVGSFQCACQVGFVGDGFVCTSDGSCGGTTCDVNAKCGLAPDGLPQCQCKIGWEGNGLTCFDINECESVSCPANADCINSAGSYECRCRLGFSKNGSECQVDNTCGGVACDAHAQCVQHADGRRECVCNAGWVQDAGRACLDIDECQSLSNPCHKDADCTNTPGSYSCRCRLGFAGDGQICEADGTCAGATCHPDASCHRNTAFGTRCVCNPGYLGDGRKCTDIDECLNGEHNCSDKAICTNSEGAFSCKCLLGYDGGGFTCTTDGTCEGVKCDPNAKCIAASPSGENRTCACNDGFSGNGLFCRDIDECALGHANCHRKAECVNQLGSFVCRCVIGYVGNGVDCKSDGTCEGKVCDFNGECVAKNNSDGETERTCRCKEGFEGDGIICTDQDECLKGPCPQNAKCVNNFGSYLCICNPGYKKVNGKCEKLCIRCMNGGSCVENNGCECPKGFSGKRCQWYGDASLIFTKGNSVQRMSLPPRPSAIGLLYQSRGHVNVGVDYDCVEEYIYWTEIMEGCIMRAKYDGTKQEVVIPRKQVKSPEGIAVDWMGRNIYWTDTGLDVIEVAGMNGSNRRVLISNALDDPRAILVDPPNGKLYWADWTRRRPRIEVANMDGSNRRVLVYSDLGLPNGLTLVRATNELCFTDAGTWSIRCVDLGALNVRKVIYPIAYPYGIASFNRTLFWTDWMNNKVQRIGMDSKDPGVPLKTYVGQSGKIFDVKAVQPCPKKASAKYPCEVNNGGCMGLCLLRPGGHTCSCPVHMYTVTTDKGTICKDKCEDPLGIEEGIIEDAQMTASSAWNNNFKRYGAHRARINLESWPAGWNAKRFDPDPWLQIDLGSVKTVTSVATQGLGHGNHDEWVKTYRVSTSLDGETWFVHQNGDRDKIFMGNNDGTTVKRNEFKPNLKTRWLRIHPRTWNNNVALRLELYGC